MTQSSPWRIEARALVTLAIPMIAGNVAWSGIAATDLLLVGRLGAEAVAAGALAINLFNALLIFGLGLVTAAAPLIASGQLVRLLPDYVPQALGIHGVYSSRRQMPSALRAMLDFLVDWFRVQPNVT